MTAPLELVAIDGASIAGREHLEADVVIVGSGPAGATVARALARRGARVVVVEEGPYVPPEQYRPDALGAMATIYRDLGASLIRGRAPMPFVQGRAVGGTSVVNGAISWRLPEDVYSAWGRDDPALLEALPWPRLERLFEEIERDLSIAPTAPEVAGPKNLLLARAAEARGLAHRPISRNVAGCEGLGRCLQGCPLGHKRSMDQTYLADAVRAGARVVASARVDEITVERRRASGVRARAAGGGELVVSASRAVVLAASAVQTPALLLSSGIHHGPTGDNFQCHPGVSVAGRFDAPIRAWTGATQGHEVTGLRSEGIKIEVLGFDLAIAAMRAKAVGRALSRELASLEHLAFWGAAIKASARGRVRPGRGRVKVSMELERSDLAKMRRGAQVLGELLFAAGAREVFPGIHGWHERVTDPAVMARLEAEAPWDPRAYSAAVTHMFGTCRMGTDATRSVVRLDFRHHVVDRLYIADSSVFPTNTGVNPQTAIIALAAVCAEHVAAG